MQIVLNAREINTKHIPAGTLMNQNKIAKVLNSTRILRDAKEKPRKNDRANLWGWDSRASHPEDLTWPFLFLAVYSRSRSRTKQKREYLVVYLRVRRVRRPWADVTISSRARQEKIIQRKRSLHIEYFIESALHGFLFTSCKTLENERVSAASEFSKDLQRVNKNPYKALSML